MLRVMSIQTVEGESMVCSQCLVSYYWRAWKLNDGEVFICIHGVQTREDHWDLKEILSWMALFLTDCARWNLSCIEHSQIEI